MIDIDGLREDEEAQRRPLWELFAKLGNQAAPDDTPLRDMPFNVRCQNCLNNAGLITLRHLNRINVQSLLHIRSFGWGTLEHLLAIYPLSYRRTFHQPGFRLSVAGEAEGNSELHKTLSVLTEAHRLTAPRLTSPLTALSFSNEAACLLAQTEVMTLGDLLARTLHELSPCPRYDNPLLTEIREKVSLSVEQWVLTDTLHELLRTGPLKCQALDAAARAFNVPSEGIRQRLLDVSGTVILSDQVHWVEGTERDILPQWDFDSYRDLLVTVLQSRLSTRQVDVVSDHYGLLSEPLSRMGLAEKQGVVPQRVYQILAKGLDRLKSQPLLLSLLRLPVRELLRQAHGLISMATLEEALVTQFWCAPGEVRGAGVLAMLNACAGSAGGIAVLDGRLVMASPVTPEMCVAVAGNLRDHVAGGPGGVTVAEMQGVMAQHWAGLLPGHPAPDVAAEDLAWLDPKIVVEDGMWHLRRRGRRARVTDRPTQIGQMEAVLAEIGRPMMVQDLFDAYRERYGGINVPACRTMLKKNEGLFRAYDRGVYGLTTWRDYVPSEIEAIRLGSRRSNPRTLRDKIEAVLEENGLPMHVQDLLHALQRRFEEGDDRSIRSALLNRSERFRSHGNGVYGLTAWGEDAARELEEAIVEYLERRGYPATETEICDGLTGHTVSAPVCRWALRLTWERSGAVVPLDGGLWDLGNEDATEAGPAGVSVDDLLLEQLLSC